MDTEKFERLVAKAIENLPDEFCERMENVDIVVEDEPTDEQLTKLEREHGESLFGLYEGIPLTQRSNSYGFVMPDKITIFRKPIEAVCRNENEIIEQIQDTVQHEIAHHFGIDDDRLEELGLE